MADPAAAAPHTAVPAATPGPNGEEWCWWQCTVKGGREARPIDAVAVAKASEALGAGEIMLNAIDNDGTGKVRTRAFLIWGAIAVCSSAKRGVACCCVCTQHKQTT